MPGHELTSIVEMGRAVASEGKLLVVAVPCVDTDVSEAIEEIGVDPVLSYFGKTYVRGYDGYTVSPPGPVKHSKLSLTSEKLSAPAP